MKTSFAKTFDLISKNDSKDQPCDRRYKSRISKFEVTSDGSEINPNNILVINSEDNSFDASSKISTFLASKDLKNKYDEIYRFCRINSSFSGILTFEIKKSIQCTNTTATLLLLSNKLSISN